MGTIQTIAWNNTKQELKDVNVDYEYFSLFSNDEKYYTNEEEYTALCERKEKVSTLLEKFEGWKDTDEIYLNCPCADAIAKYDPEAYLFKVVSDVPDLIREKLSRNQ